jgi:DNA/RNA-binding domain of Phe-tRNA-synthetase-like protein
MFQMSLVWKTTYPEASAGILAMRGVTNPTYHSDLEAQKQRLQDQLRTHFSGLNREAIAALPAIQAYTAYYKKFNKTYHVQLQLESLAFKGKSMPSVAALVEAMFMAEIDNLLLTAGHDLDALQPPVTLDVSKGDERYTLLRGQEQMLKPGDMLMADQAGVISSILYGPDQRTQITASTRNVLFTVYAPPGIEAQVVRKHLGDIQNNVLLVSPQATTELLEVYSTNL